MGNKQSTVENSCIQELSKINEEELDISRIDKLQIKALKEINNKIEKLNKKNLTRLCINYLQPPANILSQPPAYIPAYIQTSISQQHHIFLNLKSLLIRNCHAQTALHELVDDHVFLTSARCEWHSNPNFWGEMERKRFVWCASQTCWCPSSQVFGRVCLCIRHECTECQACEGSLA